MIIFLLYFKINGHFAQKGQNYESGIYFGHFTSQRMASRGDYKSSLHYLVLLPANSGLAFEGFLLYFTNKNIGRLDLAISETILRDAFHKRLGSFYNHNSITWPKELVWISSRSVSVERCDATWISAS